LKSEEESSIGKIIGMIIVALVICAGIGAAVYFGVDGILKSVRGLKLKLNV